MPVEVFLVDNIGFRMMGILCHTVESDFFLFLGEKLRMTGRVRHEEKGDDAIDNSDKPFDEKDPRPAYQQC